LYLSHPVLSNQSWLAFQSEYLKTFLSPNFLRAYIDFTYTKKVKEYMKVGVLLNDIPIDYSLKYNEMKFGVFENRIKLNPLEFYDEKKMNLFHKRDSVQKYSDKVIFEKQLEMLSEIRDILIRNKTQYRIIINPLYDQIKINSSDIEILYKIFDKAYVFDFSGINFITNDYHNYYENSHYRPHVADYIMKEIYK